MSSNEIHESEDFIRRSGASGGFTVPEEDLLRMKERILNRTARQGFRVPEGYFDKLGPEILAKVHAEKGRKINFVPDPYFKWSAIAAAVLLVSAIVFRFIPSQPPAGYEAAMNTLTEEEIVRYVDWNDIQDPGIFDASVTKDLGNSSELEKYLQDEMNENDLINTIEL